MEISHSAQFLQFAFERRFAYPAFNVWNLEIGKALVKGLPGATAGRCKNVLGTSASAYFD
jgi:fructose/tagatose bisphosphate aldolase